MRTGLGEFFRGLLSDSTYTHSDWDERHLLNRDWRQFEELIAVLWEDMGYDTRLQQGRKDGGVDVIAEATNRIPFSDPPKIAIQAKRWTQKVEEPLVRDLFGVQCGGHRHSSTDVFDESVLVTSSGRTDDRSGFTQGARQFAEENGVELIDGETLLELLNESNLSPLRLGRKPGNKWHLRESPRCGWSHKFDENRSYAHTAEKVFNTEERLIEATDTYVSVTTDEVCEACLNLRRE
ncbi:restriction endonuclease [Haloplanus salilacus]|uniref:restriction endonuclease n=1 Tax=Haloplanus salilacus TaxID=2949994 RepID=UPI0030D36BF5